jgi:hypothetical protein
LSKRSTSKPPDPVVYFLDRNLGPTADCDVVRILRESGMLVEAHDTHYSNRVPDDEEWLRLCGERGWVGLSRDKEMQWKDIAVTTVMTYGVKAFVCIGKWPHPQIAQNIVNSRNRMDRVVRKHPFPFIARLYMADDDARRRGKAGEVKLWLTYPRWLELKAAEATAGRGG